MSNPHPHAALIKIWADNPDTKFEFQDQGADWQSTVGTPCWNYHVKYRLKPEPHAEVKAAFKNGAKIQYRDNGTYGAWKDIEYPAWFENAEYRIKPDPVRRWVPMFLLPAGSLVVGMGFADRHTAISSNWNGKSPSETLHAVLAMEFDPETKALISCTQEAP